MDLRLRCVLVVLGFVLLTNTNSVRAQQPPEFVQMGKSAGVRTYDRQRWGIVGVELKNPSGDPVDLLSTTYLEGEAGRQFARQFWIPPHAKRVSWYPVLPPRPIQWKQQFFNAQSLLLDRSGENEIIRRQSGEQVLHAELLPYHRHESVTGLLSSSTRQDDAGNDLALEIVVCIRLANEISRAVHQLNHQSLPAIAEAWQAISVLVLADDRITDDMAALIAVRRWIYDGGHLWILLDQVAPATLEALFGDAIEFEIIDSVGLTEVMIESKAANDSPPARTFDDPVEFVRIVPSGVDVTHTVNGWPAAFWKTLGRGEILCTTLGPEAWMRLRTSDDKQPIISKYIANLSLEQLSKRLFEPREKSQFALKQLQPPLLDQIGYDIVSRGSVLAVLGTFCGGLILTGIWFRRNGKLERFGILAPPAAIAATFALIFMGMQSTRAVPSTAAEVHLVDVIPGAEDVQMKGLVALYHQQKTSGELGARRGGVFQPELAGFGAATRRMVWTDLDQWHWENLTLPSGVCVTPFHRTARLDRPIAAQGTFGPRGFTGKLDCGPFTNPGDAIIVGSSRSRFAVHLSKEGVFTSGPEDLLSSGQFLSGHFIDNVQRRRQEMYRELFAKGIRAREYDRPALLFWSDHLETEFSFPDIKRHVGSALVHVPLTIERSPAGTEFVIAQLFMNVSVAAGPNEQPGSVNTYDVKRDSWPKKKDAALTWLRFGLPTQILPVDVSELKLTVSINAPFRPLKILALAGERSIPIDEIQSSIGTFTFSIKDPAGLMLDADGGLTVGIHVGDASNGTNIGWKIEYVRIEVRGRSLEP